MKQQQNVTSISIPTILFKYFNSKELRNVLKEYLCTTSKERKSLSVSEKNFTIKNAVYRMEVDMNSQNPKKINIRLFPIERQALKFLTGQTSLREAIITALCAMKILKNTQQNPSGSQQPERIIPASPYMGWKNWFLEQHLEIMGYINNNHPGCTKYVEPFMGSGILVENVTARDYFNDVASDYYDTRNLDYFYTIGKYPAFFKSLVLCLDQATSLEDQEKAKKIIDDISKSLELISPRKASKILDALEFFLGQNTILTEHDKKKLQGLKNTSVITLDISERISIILESISRWKKRETREKQNPQSPVQYYLKPRGLHKKVDSLAKESAVLQQIRISNKDALAFLKKYVGKPEYVIVCDPPYFDTLGYKETFLYEKHEALAKLLKKHAKTGGFFIYFGRITAPRSYNAKADIDYSELDKIYKGKYDKLFKGKGFFYKDYPYSNNNTLERVTTNLQLPGYFSY